MLIVACLVLGWFGWEKVEPGAWLVGLILLVSSVFYQLYYETNYTILGYVKKKGDEYLSNAVAEIDFNQTLLNSLEADVLSAKDHAQGENFDAFKSILEKEVGFSLNAEE